MADLDIYDKEDKPQRRLSTQQRVFSYLGLDNSDSNDVLKRIKQANSERKQITRETEEMVLQTVKPVTRYVPVTYDTVKRVGTVSLCFLAGRLYGKQYGRVRKTLYSALGLAYGMSVVYPDQSYNASVKTYHYGKRTTEYVSSVVLPVITSVGSTMGEKVSKFKEEAKLKSKSFQESHPIMINIRRLNEGDKSFHRLFLKFSAFDKDDTSTEDAKVKVENITVKQNDDADMYSTRTDK